MATNVNITINWNEKFPYFITGTNTDLQILLNKSDGTSTDVTSTSKILVLDEYPMFLSGISTLNFRRPGSGIVKVLYNDGNKDFIKIQEFITYDTFFKDKYLDYFVTQFDKTILLKNKKMRIIFNTLMEYFDIIYAYKTDIKNINDLTNVKSVFLNSLGQSLGFDRIDVLSTDTDNELISDNLYRELLKNLFDLLQIRGTKLSYELLFGALGYDVKIEEFWWNDEGTLLIQLNEEQSPFLNDGSPNPDYDSTLYTFRRYNPDGSAFDDGTIKGEDPRKFNDPNNPYNIAQKSNYVRIRLNSFNTDLANGFLSREARKVLKEYLEFLRPIHINYFPELLTIPGASDNLDDVNDAMRFTLVQPLIDQIPPDQIDDSLDSQFLIGLYNRFSNELETSAYKYDTGLRYDDKTLWKGKYDVKDLFNEDVIITKL